MLSFSRSAPGTIPEVISIPGFADPVSSMSHLLAAGIFAVLAIFLLRSAHRHGRVTVLAIFAFTVVLMFSISGVFHLLPRGSTGRAVLLRIDHASILLLIAGSLTAVHGILFRGWLRWGVIAFAWVFVATAIPLRTVFFERMPEWLSLSLYLGLGWVGLLSTIVLWHRYGWRFTMPILLGGIAYTVGAVIDFLRRPNPIPDVVNAHDLWHLFVILGAAFHWRFCEQIADISLTKPPMNIKMALQEMHLRRGPSE
jgi:channel protein (hemolysin III family)